MLELGCPRCGFRADADEAPPHGCPACDEHGKPANLSLIVPTAPGLPLTAADFHASMGTPGISGPTDTDAGIWRFAPRLPGARPADRVSAGEGNTPVVRLDDLPDRPADLTLLAKDETLNPTLSHKDRFSAAAVSRARSRGAVVAALGSSGNGGISAAAYAARAGMACVVFVTPHLPDAPRRYMEALGASIIAVENGVDRWRLLDAAARAWTWYPLGNRSDPPVGGDPFGIAAYKTIAFELFEQLGRVPDLVAVPLALGDALSGILQGFVELRDLAAADRIPSMIAVAPEAPGSIAYNLRSGAPTHQARAALEASSGELLVVPEAEILRVRERLARHCGVFAEASSVAAVWGACRAAGAGQTAVAILTSTGLKDPPTLRGPGPGEPSKPIPVDLEALEAVLPPSIPSG